MVDGTALWLGAPEFVVREVVEKGGELVVGSRRATTCRWAARRVGRVLVRRTAVGSGCVMRRSEPPVGGAGPGQAGVVVPRAVVRHEDVD